MKKPRLMNAGCAGATAAPWGKRRGAEKLSSALIARWFSISELATPARTLLTARTTPTFVVTAPFPPDDSSVGYERGVAVSKAWDEATTQAAIETAHQVVRQLDRLTQSKPADTNRLAKVEAFCDEFV